MGTLHLDLEDGFFHDDVTVELGGTTVALDGFGVEKGFDVLEAGVRDAAEGGIGVRVFGPADRIDLSGVAGVELIDVREQITAQPVPAAQESF